MAQVEYRELIPEVLATASACPTPTIIRNARNAAIELAQKSGAFRFRLEGDLAIADLARMEFSLPTQTSLVKPVSLTIDGSKLDAYSVRMLDRDHPGWRSECGKPTKWLRDQNTLNSVTLYPAPNATYTVHGEVAVKPTRDSDGIEDIYMDLYFNTIVDGTLARLLAIPAAPWFSPKTALYHKQLFIAEIDEARRIADTDDSHKQRKIVYGGM